LIEQALYFAIGFLSAALAAIAAAPLVSRRAMRLAMARARLRAPVTEKQAIADMDALRAQHAVEQARIERRLSLTEEVATGLRAALGRQSAELLRLGARLAERDDELHDMRAEAEKLISHSRDLEAAVGATQIALHDAFLQRDRASAARDAAEARLPELEADASRDRARIAVLAARAEFLEGRMKEMAKEMAATRAAQGATASAPLETERARVAVLEERLRLSERSREETLLANGRQLAELADQAAALAAATGRLAGLEARLKALAEESHARENASSLRAETLDAARAAMEESLRAARAERDALQRENESLRGRIAGRDDDRASDAELRELIGRLGREVVRLFSAQEPSGESSSGERGGLPGGRGAEPSLASADGEARRVFGAGRRRRTGSRGPQQ
jgi:chromosome segregation ATPase